MQAQLFLRSDISIALKTPKGEDFGLFQGPYGAGFNAELEVGWTGDDAKFDDRIAPHFKDYLAKIDHRHLGLDAPELSITTTESLVMHCFRHFEQIGFAPSTVRLMRGEDTVYELSCN